MTVKHRVKLDKDTTVTHAEWGENRGLIYIYLLYIDSEKAIFLCDLLYLQVEGMFEFQTEKLLLLQLEKILTVCEALWHLW